jgi:hypothetical protein
MNRNIICTRVDSAVIGVDTLERYKLDPYPQMTFSVSPGLVRDTLRKYNALSSPPRVAVRQCG